MSSRASPSDQRAAYVSGAAGDKNAMGLRIHRRALSAIIPRRRPRHRPRGDSRHRLSGEATLRDCFAQGVELRSIGQPRAAVPTQSVAPATAQGQVRDRIWYTVAFRSLRNSRTAELPGPLSCIEAKSPMKDTLGVLLAGGAGERLYPLTRDRAKPAVTFGGIYRIIDVTLSNCVNSDLRRVYILTQYKALSLNRHVREGWR